MVSPAAKNPTKRTDRRPEANRPEVFLLLPARAAQDANRTMRRIEIYDTTLRDGAQGEGISFSLQDKLLLTQRLDSLGFDYVEGGYPASNEKDAQYFQRVGQLGSEARQGLRLRHDPPQGRQGRADDPGLKALLDSGAAVITLVGKASAFQVDRSAADHAGREPGDDPRERRAIWSRAGREVIFDAEHFFDGWKTEPRLRAASRRRRPPRPAHGWSCSATPTAAACPTKSPQITARRGRRAVRAGRHPLPQRLRSGRGQLAGRGRGRGRQCRARSTASASAAATPT